MAQYSITRRDFSRDDIISAPMARLAETAKKVTPLFPTCKWIYPLQYVRFHTYREFELNKPVAKVAAAFLADNLFDVYMNGSMVADGVRELGMTDVTSLVKEGYNILHITGYQTDDFDHVISGLCGGIRVWYQDGTTEDIVTDESFMRIQFINFWQNEEPEGFATATTSKYGKPTHMLAFPMHPKALRRSYWFKRSFETGEMPVRATLCATALGMYEARVNGERVTDGRFMPSSMEKCKEYQEFDILPLLKKGSNTVTFLTGNGWYNCESWGSITANVPAVISDITLAYADGREEVIRTDGSWLCCPSPMTEDDIQYGEKYDARLEREDAFTEACEGGDWTPVETHENALYGDLVKQSYPFVRAVRTHACRFLRHLPDGSPLFDAGQEIAGRSVVVMKGLTRGQCVRIRYCERLKDDGMPENVLYGAVYYDRDCEPGGRSRGLMRNMDLYIARGDATETYECRFSYTGFRYIWIEGLTDDGQLVKLTATELHNDLTETGFIETGNEDVQWIYDASKLSWINNICNGPTDCPTREKNFWNGDTYMFADTACFLTDNSKLLAIWTDKGRKMGRNAYGWDEEEYALPMTLYHFYGDKEILRAKFGEMLKLIEKRTEYPGMLLPKDPIGAYFGDWLSPQGIMPSQPYFLGIWYYRCLRDTARVARILGEDAIAGDLEKRAKATRDEFNRLYILPDGSDTTEKCQGAIVFALQFDMADPWQRKPLVEQLVRYIEKEDWHLTTGFLSSRFLLGLLCDEGYAWVAEKLLLQRTFPSWISIKESGATSMTESWHGTHDPDRSNSMCHFAYGSVTGWLFEYLGGIRFEESEPGLRHVVLRPVMLPGVGDFSVRFMTQYGEIRTEWHFEDGKPHFSYSVPEGMTAEVHI